MTIEQSWSHSTGEIAPGGIERHLSATDDERTALVAALGLLALERLEIRYRIIPRAGGRFHFKGQLRARVVQECSITLEPVTSDIDEQIDLEFWPGEKPPEPAAGEHEALAIDEIEPIENDRLAVGRVVFETLAAALDPFPRAEGAEFDWHDASPPSQSDNPFAALARLKPKPE
ncbi:MAG: DUF177 domain-containing protein [Pirellulaceae bacterium]